MTPGDDCAIITVDLFGEVVDPVPPEQHLIPNGRQPTKKNGYAAPPGSGPQGETCRGCKHYRSVEYHDKRYPKCILMRRNWTHGSGTDILARSPACKWWTMPDMFKADRIDIQRKRIPRQICQTNH